MNYEIKLVEENDIELLINFKDDENTKYDKKNLLKFIEDKSSYGFVIKFNNNVVGFAYGYKHLRPDGKNDFYLHSIDVMKEYQGQGIGTKLMCFINDYIKNNQFRKMFLVTNKSNESACKCYEHAGGINSSDDDIVYDFK